MADEDVFDLGLDNMQEQIEALLRDIGKMPAAINEAAASAMDEAAQLIANEQKRLLSTAHFKHSTVNLASLIKVEPIKLTETDNYLGRGIGYSTEAIRRYPELLVIEYGRPGKSARRMSPYQKDFIMTTRNGKKVMVKERRKGEFPQYEVCPHIYAGFYIGADKASKHFRDALCEVLEKIWGER